MACALEKTGRVPPRVGGVGQATLPLKNETIFAPDPPPGQPLFKASALRWCDRQAPRAGNLVLIYWQLRRDPDPNDAKFLPLTLL